MKQTDARFFLDRLASAKRYEPKVERQIAKCFEFNVRKRLRCWRNGYLWRYSNLN